MRRCDLFAWALALVAILPVSARAGDAGVRDSTDSAQLAIELPLQKLPAAPVRRLEAASAEDRQLLDDVLKRLISESASERQAGLAALFEVDSSLLPAVREAVDSKARGANRAAMKQLLLNTRGKARAELEKAMRARGEKGEVETPDYLAMMVSHARPDSKNWRDLVEVLALSRICGHLGTTPAVRVLIHVFVRFEFLRIDTQLQLKKLGEKALPALIETTRHEAVSVSNWAKRRLDFLGKAIASEVVQVEDPEVLADVLRAYGHTSDPDAARIVISFANSERAQVREAARQGVSLFGETAHWPLRDTYEQMVGRKPPREWSWDRTARELFREFDRIRLSELYGEYQRGLRSLDHGDMDKMKQAFDRVLARSPEFEPREQLVAGYLKYSQSELTKDRDAAALAAQRVMRLASDEDDRQRAESVLLTVEALGLSEKHVADRALLRRALELDGGNETARSLLAELSREPMVESSEFMRVLWPSILAGLSLLFALLVGLRFIGRRTSPRHD